MAKKEENLQETKTETVDEQAQNTTEKQEENKQKKASLITKETLCAVFALFSILALLIMFTGTVIFGDVGYFICSFLTGVLGYMAYPLLLCALYLSVMGLIGKSLVKNKKAGTAIVFTVLFLALLIHAATTASWSMDGYLAACFDAAKAFPQATVFGFLGGLLVFALSAATTQVGAVIIFAVLTLLCGYLSYVAIKGGVKLEKKIDAQPVQKPQTPTVIPVEIPLTQAQVQTQAQAQPGVQQQPVAPIQPTFTQPVQPVQSMQPTQSGQAYVRAEAAYTEAEVQQRPAFTLADDTPTSQNTANAAAPSQSGAFSPFGSVQSMRHVPQNNIPQDSRAFLFGSTPAENYKRNLIFDPNARVNNMPPMQSGYTPSYTEAYQSSLGGTSSERPQKIVTDFSATHMANEYPTTTEDYAPVTPLQPIEPQTIPVAPIPQVDVETPAYNEDLYKVEEPQMVEEEPQEQQRGYERHDYMDLFSPSNPNVFGSSAEDRSFARETFSAREGEDSRMGGLRTDSLFDTGREEIVSRGEERFEETDERLDDGLHIFDEPTDSPYTLRGDFDDSPLDLDENIERTMGREGFSRDTLNVSNEREFTEPVRGARDFAGERGFEIVEDDFTVERRSFDEVEEQPTRQVESEQKPFVAPQPIPEPPKVEPPKPRIIRPYVRVPIDDFDCRDVEPKHNTVETEEIKANILATLERFKVSGASIASVTYGPTVTRYNVVVPLTIPPKKVVSLEEPISMSLHASGVNIYPNYEDGVVSIEVPNGENERQTVQLGSMLTGDTFVNSKPSSIMFAMGKDVANRKVYGDISKMIHLLVAGSSGSGKSVFLGALIISLIYKYSPEELRLILIDPKKTEFVIYNHLPHLMIDEIINEPRKAVQSLNWAIGEMERRYTLFEQMSLSGTYVVNLDQYNAQIEKSQRLPKIVIIIDELADLMLAAKKDVEDKIQSLTQKARAAGIHLVVATQRPSTDVITGVIKSNLNTRIAFTVASDVDSRVILDQTGAQKLLGKGDFLYTMQGITTPVRVQSAFISAEDSQRVVNFIKSNNESYYDETATSYINNTHTNMDGGSISGGSAEIEPVFIEALRFVIRSESASISLIQRKCGIGYNKAGKIVEWMEEMGYITSFDGAKARKVLITKEEFESKYGEL